jgi:hypothetical protein
MERAMAMQVGSERTMGTAMAMEMQMESGRTSTMARKMESGERRQWHWGWRVGER